MYSWSSMVVVVDVLIYEMEEKDSYCVDPLTIGDKSS